MRLGDFADDRIVEQFAARHRAIGGQDHAVPAQRRELLDDPIVGEIAKARGKTHAQICLRWLIQQPMVAAVPRALEEAHIAENLDVFDFSLKDEEMRRISALRSRNIRIADPPERAPKWDVETVA